MSSYKETLRDLAAMLLHKSGRTRPRRVMGRDWLVVTFHRVLPEEDRSALSLPTLAVTPEELAWHLEWFQQHFHCLPVREVARRVRETSIAADRPFLSVSFDDGTSDNWEHAAPVLERAGVRASFFIVADAVSQGTLHWHDRVAYSLQAASDAQRIAVAAIVRDHGCAWKDGEHEVSRMLEWLKSCPANQVDRFVTELSAAVPAEPPAFEGLMRATELRALAKAGHEIGAHSATHAILTQCDDARLERETAGARRTLCDLLGEDVTSFCYPNGDHDDRVVEAVREAGFTTAVTTRWGHNGAGADPLRWKRCDIQSSTSRNAAGSLSSPRLSWRLSGLHPGLPR